MLVKPKKKVLAWSDSAITKTGFGVVSKYILGAIHKVGDYDIDHLAINFHGDFVDTSIVPWQQQPAKLLDPKDPHGIKMFARTLAKKDYDIVWVCNDLYVTHQAAEIINKVRQRAVTRGECPPIFIYYYPVDCHVPEDGCDFLKLVNIPVCYTRHGKQETLKTIPDAYGKLKEVPHGVDTEVFSPASPKQAAEWKRQFLGVSPETTMVINVNRNNPRKQMQYSMLAFKEFKKKVPNSIMYMHTAVQDQGGDLIRAVKDLGMSVKDDIVFPVRYSPSNPAPDSVLNSLYNAADIFLTTHLGEGWGMSCGSNTHINTHCGIKFLKDIQIGDRVLTGNGEYEEVLNTTSREEPFVYELKPKFSPAIITSDLHPYYASKDKGKTLEWMSVKQLNTGDYIAIVKPRDTDSIPERIDLVEYIRCESSDNQIWKKMGYSPSRGGLSISKIQKEFDISKRVAEDALNKFRGKDIPSRCLPGSQAFLIYERLVDKYQPEVVEPIKMNRFIPIDDTFLEFIGWYLAEGSSENGIRVEISLHRNEKHVAQKFRSWCREVLGIEGTVEEFENKSRLRISNSILAQFLQQECGKGSYNKHIPSWLIETPTKLGPMLKGLILGDGSFGKGGYISLATTSPSLAYQTRDICASMGILTAIAERKIGIGNYTPYCVSFKHRKRLGNFIKLDIEKEKNDINCIELKNHFLVPIESITKSEDNRELLYDLCVENSHSFVANGILAHNTQTEAMAAGVPVVAPDNTSTPQLLGKNSERGYIYPCRDQIYIDNSGFRKKGLIPDIVDKMVQAYKAGPKWNNPVVQRARKWTEEHDWKIVTKKWVKIFTDAMKMREGKDVTTTIIAEEV